MYHRVINLIEKKVLYKTDITYKNEDARQQFLAEQLSQIKNGSSILDAGAGQLKNKKLCKHLKYTSQDFCEYNGAGNSVALQTDLWDTKKLT